MASDLKRRIGLVLLILYGVGVMVGAGIYVLVGEVADVAEPLAQISIPAWVPWTGAALSAIALLSNLKGFL